LGRWTVIAALVALVILILPHPAEAQMRRHRRPQVPEAAQTPGLWQKSVAGGQFGPWLAGDFGKDLALTGGRFKGNETGFHLEFIYRPYLRGIFSGDISLGAISRGQLRITQSDSIGTITSFGDVTLYPVSVGLRIAPFAARTSWSVQPILSGGGSLLILTQRGETRFANRFRIDIDSHTEFGFYAGAGLNWILGHKFMLTGMAKYQYAEFDKDLLAGGSYSGMQILIGAAYIYR
jgi:hypothetical protein